MNATMNISEFIEIAKGLNVLGIKITKDNETVAEWHSEGECRRNIYSAAKSFTSCAVGFAVQEGLISLNEELTDAFSDDLPDSIDDNLKAATVRDLLTMCLGQEYGNLMGEQRPLYKEDDWVKMSLAIPFKFKPGTHFVYNNVGPYLAGILVQRRAGCDLVSYLTPRLFSHIGIKRPMWETDPLGNSFGAGGLFLTLSELHKFGLFYLNKGKWNGKQILSEEWIEESTKPSDTDYYGYLFGGENTILSEQTENFLSYQWLFLIRIRLSLLLPNAVKVKNLCVHYMILCVQNYKLTFSTYMLTTQQVCVILCINVDLSTSKIIQRT